VMTVSVENYGLRKHQIENRSPELTRPTFLKRDF
jgi:hypothetical protein